MSALLVKFQIQIILSAEGKITGIQPTSTFAVDHWATNPLAKELYVGKNVLPGKVVYCWH